MTWPWRRRRAPSARMPHVVITGPDGRALPVAYRPLKRGRGWCAVVHLPGGRDALRVVTATVDAPDTPEPPLDGPHAADPAPPDETHPAAPWGPWGTGW